MSRLLYIDVVGGLAGDMLLGALLDAGADVERVRRGLAGLGTEPIELTTSVEHRHSIAATHIRIGATSDHHDHRTWRDVRGLLDAAQLEPRVLERSHAMFAALAAAEGGVHGIDPDDVHFHEVGALDSIADICGIALALEDLGIEQIACSALPVAGGVIDSAHGRLPLPAPATLALLRGAPLHGVDADVELVTPTGAAVLAAFCHEFGPLPPMRLDRVGYGAGTRDLQFAPNLVRVLIGERLEQGPSPQDMAVIETNLDDMSPELVPDAIERCLAAGALDVWVTPTQMKKGRPGLVFSALARQSVAPIVAQAILRETTALGVRMAMVTRTELDRSWITVQVAGESIRVKLGVLDGETVNVAPEHDDCAAAARATGRSVKDVWVAALAAAELARSR